METKLIVGIFIFNEVEVLDFAGPFEVFSLSENNGNNLFNVITIAENKTVVSARNGLTIVPTATFDDHPPLDILIIPGGYGAEEIEIKNKKALEWIKYQQNKVKLLSSVCTGAFLLAECGILNHKKATTHWMDLDRLESEYPDINVVRNKKFVDEGSIITSGGISSGINMSFHIVARIFGIETAKKTAKRMEYDIDI